MLGISGSHLLGLLDDVQDLIFIHDMEEGSAILMSIF